MKIESCITSSLQKNMGSIENIKTLNDNKFSIFKGEHLSFQWVLTVSEGSFNEVELEVNSSVSDFINIYTVENVPVNCTCYPESDDDFISKNPGMFPDLLIPVCGTIPLNVGQFRSIWIEFCAPESIDAKTYKIKLRATHTKIPDAFSEQEIEVEIINRILKKQDLIFTQWFHYDSLADYYGVQVFSERHWELIGNYLENAVSSGVNMLLTPIFTPPLDTEMGNERKTVQLIGIEIIEGEYTFDYTNFEKLINLALQKGIKYFEMAHLFSQWGAAFTPKIVAVENGMRKNLFFWTPVHGDDKYKTFLSKLLPDLKNELNKLGILNKTYFHISDEPNNDNIEIYKKSKLIVEEMLSDCNVIDAVSDIEFFESGLIKSPIVSNNHIHNFLDKGHKIDWVYYCCGQQANCSNRFIAMPSYRNRIIGTQLFKYDIKCFLHWGYNFWYNFLSRKMINPFITTDADGTFPGGDAFSVYPGNDGKPISSIRQKVFYEALQDYRALEMLAEITSKDYVAAIIDELSDSKITFADYPKSEDYILNLRRRINSEIKELINAEN